MIVTAYRLAVVALLVGLVCSVLCVCIIVYLLLRGRFYG